MYGRRAPRPNAVSRLPVTMPAMARLTVPAAEALLDQEIKVLDHGFVRLVDYLGGDARIPAAAPEPAPAAGALLDQQSKVPAHGFVRLVDYLGGDARIVQAARVSYGDGTKTVREDAALIDYLLRNRHTSPFEQVIFTF